MQLEHLWAVVVHHDPKATKGKAVLAGLDHDVFFLSECSMNTLLKTSMRNDSEKILFKMS